MVILEVSCCSKVSEYCSDDGISSLRAGSVIEREFGKELLHMPVPLLPTQSRTSSIGRAGFKLFSVPDCTKGLKTPLKLIPPAAGLKKVRKLRFKPGSRTLKPLAFIVIKF